MDKSNFKEEVKHIIEEAEAKIKEWGEKTVDAAKKGEKEIVRMSKIGKLQLEILGMNIKKEKLFKDIGKKAVTLHSEGKLRKKEMDGLLKEYLVVEKEVEKKKKLMDSVSKKKATKKSKSLRKTPKAKKS